MRTTSVESVVSAAPGVNASRVASAPSLRRTRTSTLPVAPGAMRALGETAATSPF